MTPILSTATLLLNALLAQGSTDPLHVADSKWVVRNGVDFDGTLTESTNIDESCNCFAFSIGADLIELADPTIIWLPSGGFDAAGDPVGDGWYYISGTSTPTSNFAIYKTQDFQTFVFHKAAFDDKGAGRINRIIPDLNGPGGREDRYVYSDLNSPQLVQHPSDPNMILLLFKAVHGEIKAPGEQGLGGVPDSALDDWTPAGNYGSIRQIPHWLCEDVQPVCGGNHQSPTTHVNPLFPLDNFWACTQNASPEQWYLPAEEGGFVPLIGEAQRYATIFMVQMPLHLFVDSNIARTFSDALKGDKGDKGDNPPGSYFWFGYYDANGGFRRDGGGDPSAPGWKQIPSTVIPYDTDPTIGTAITCRTFTGLAGCGACQPCSTACQDSACCGCTNPFGMAHGRYDQGVPIAWQTGYRTAMVDGPFLFDDQLGASNEAWLMYGWNRVGCGPDWDYASRGTAVAMGKVERTSVFAFDSTRSIAPVAARENRSNMVRPYPRAPDTHFVSNGRLGRDGRSTDPSNDPDDHTPRPERNRHFVGESPSAFRLDFNGGTAYQVFYSRNSWDSPGYCIVYRSDSAADEIYDMRLSHWDDHDVTEHLLVSAKYYADGSVHDRRNVDEGRSYGNGEMFYLRAPDGRLITRGPIDTQELVPYLIFHMKFDNTDQRTLLVKNLERVYGHKYRQLAEHHTELGKDTWRYEIPYFFTVDLSTTTAQPDGYEGNDTIGDVAVLPACAPNSANLGCPSPVLSIEDLTIHNGHDIDIFRVYLPAEGTAAHTAAITFDAVRSDLDLELLDDQEQRQAVSDGISGTEAVSFEGLAPGPYSLRVTSWDDTTCADYDLTITFPDSPPTGCAIADTTTTGSSAASRCFGSPDGTINLSDLNHFVAIWTADTGTPTSNPGSPADLTTTGSTSADPAHGQPDGNVDLADLQFFLNIWDPCQTP